MNMKKVISVTLALAISVTTFAAGSFGTTNAALAGTKVKLGLATDEGGKGDKSFNDSAIAGLNMAKAKYGSPVQILESKKTDDYVPYLQTLSDANDLTFGVGFKMNDAMAEVAADAPDKKFAIIDASPVGKDGKPLSNVMSLLFKENEGSFLVGIVAAKTSKTGKIGFIGGMDSPLIQKFEAGFAAGVMSVNKKAGALLVSRKNVRYAGNFFDDKKGYELAKNLYGSGCDVIFHAAGGVGLGLFRAAQETKHYAIGVDQDQALALPKMKNVILCSMMKRVDNATLFASTAAIKGTFKGGITKTFGLKEDGVGISKTVNKAVAKTTLTLADKYKAQIIKGKIKVPTTLAELKKFKPVVLK